MDRIPLSPPVIVPLSNQGTRPLWSVMIPVYNCAEYLKEAINSVLVQDMGPEQMQIEVVDDASTDADVEALVRELGQGRIQYYRQPVNVGSLRNFETCINRARGHLVHLLHGDDRVRPGYYAKLTELFDRFPEAGAAFTNCAHIHDELLDPQPVEMIHDGVIEDWLHKIAKHQRLQYVSIAVRRLVYESLGSFYGVTYGEDWEMWVRIAKNYPVAYSPQVLAEYRVHTDNISGAKLRTGQAFRDIEFVMGLIQHHIAPERRQEILAESRKIWADYGVTLARKIWLKTRNLSWVNIQVREVLRMHFDSQIGRELTKLYIEIASNKFVPKWLPVNRLRRYYRRLYH